MSITINQQPAQMQPAYNQLIYLVQSTNTSQPNFRYVFDVYSGATLLSRLKIPARPADSRGLFDASAILRSYLNLNFPAEYSLNADFTPASSLLYSHSVKIGEEYGSTPSGYYSLAVANNKYAWHGAVEWLDFPAYSMGNYILQKGVANGHFFSAQSLNQKIAIGNFAWQTMAVNPSGTASAAGRAVFKKYDANGTLIDTLNVSNGYAQSYGLFSLGCGPANLNNTSAGWIDSNVNYYTLQIQDSDNANCSQLITYTIQSSCIYDIQRVHFLNRLGGLDHFNFIGVSRPMADITRQQYKKVIGSTSGTTWGYKTSDRGDSVFDANEKRKITINSDWLSEDESSWLLELASSPNIFLEVNGSWQSMTAKITSYENMKKQNKQVFNLTIELDYSYMNKRQIS